jgi:hypothetical protein
MHGFSVASDILPAAYYCIHNEKGTIAKNIECQPKFWIIFRNIFGIDFDPVTGNF